MWNITSSIYIYIHPLVICDIAMEAMAHRNRLFFSMDLPSLKMVDFETVRKPPAESQPNSWSRPRAQD